MCIKVLAGVLESSGDTSDAEAPLQLDFLVFCQCQCWSIQLDCVDQIVAHVEDSSSELLRAKTLILGEEGDEEAGFKQPYVQNHDNIGQISKLLGWSMNYTAGLTQLAAGPIYSVAKEPWHGWEKYWNPSGEASGSCDPFRKVAACCLEARRASQQSCSIWATKCSLADSRKVMITSISNWECLKIRMLETCLFG